MISINNLIGKSVLNLYSGKIEGTIFDVVFNEKYKKVTKIKLFDCDEEEYTISTDKIYSATNNNVVIKNSEPLNLVLNDFNIKQINPINLQVFSTLGENLGNVVDIQCDDNFNIESFLTTTQNIPINKILNISNNIIVNFEDKKILLNKLKPKFQKQIVKSQNVVTIMPKIEDSNSVETDIKQKSTYKVDTKPLPTKISTNSNLLIGRKALKTIYGLNNEVIIKKDNIINSKHLTNAQKHSKLVELTIFSQAK